MIATHLIHCRTSTDSAVRRIHTRFAQACAQACVQVCAQACVRVCGYCRLPATALVCSLFFLFSLFSLVSLCWSACTSSSASAQVLKIFDVDTTDFPKVKAKLYAIDAAGKQITGLQASQLSITENGVPRTVMRIGCSPVKAATPVSVVVTMDVSGSMAGGGIQIAKAAAKALIEALPLGSDCAITSFDHSAYLHADFTADKKELLRAVQAVKPQGGTNYDQGFYAHPASALELLKHARNKRVVVFLTDGLGGGEEAAIVRAARDAKASIFCVTVAMPAPSVLRSVALRTGGTVAEDVTTAAQATEAFQTMLLRAQGLKPCDVEWQSAPRCDPETRVIARAQPNYGAALVGGTGYMVPQRGLVGLEFSTNSVGFRSIMPGTVKDIPVTVTARNGDFVVSGFAIGDKRFTVSPSSFALPAGQRIELLVRFSPPDSSFAYAEIRAQTDLCGTSPLYAAGGFPDKDPEIPTLKVLQPNGGEALVVGTDTTITWSGILPQDRVRLDLSTDAGTTWTRISKPATGLKARWYRIPNITTNKALIRVSQPPRWEKPFVLAAHEGSATGTAWSPDGSRILTYSSDKTVRVWDTLLVFGTRKASRPVQILGGNTSAVTASAWNPRGTMILSAGNDGMVKLWDAAPARKMLPMQANVASNSVANSVANSPEKLPVSSSTTVSTTVSATVSATVPATTSAMISSSDRADAVEEHASAELKPETNPRRYLIGHRAGVVSAVWSSTGTQILTASKDFSARIWNAETGEVVRVLGGITQNESAAQANANANTNVNAASTTNAANSINAIFSAKNAAQAALLASPNGHKAALTAAAWSPDEKRVLTASADKTARVWSVETGDTLFVLNGHRGEVLSALWSPDGTKIATTSADSTVALWDGTTGKLLRRYYAHQGAVRVAAWDSLSKQIAAASDDGMVCVWNAGNYSTPILRQAEYELLSELDQTILQSVNTALGVPRRYQLNSGVILDSTALDVMSEHLASVRSLVWDSPRKRLFTASADQSAFAWKAEKVEENGVKVEHFDLAAEFSGHAEGITAMALNPEGKRLVTTASDGTLLVWKTQAAERQRDVSDNVFSIVKPEGAASDVQMGAVIVGTSRDSLLAGYVRNVGTYPLMVREIKILSAGSPSTEFSVVSGKPPFVIPAQSSKAVEFGFKPAKLGPTRATIVIYTNADTLRQQIVGKGVPPPLQFMASTVDMGVVPVGTQRDSVLAGWLRNTTPRPLQISSVRQTGPNTSDFALFGLDDKGKADKLERLMIPANGMRAVLVRYKPSRGGKTSGSAAFEYYGFGSPATLRLVGEGGVRMFVLQGRVADSAGNPLRAKLRWIDLDRQEVLGEIKCDPEGSYAIEVPEGKRYGLYFERGGYLPVSRSRDFRTMSDSGAVKTLDNGNVLFAENTVVMRSLEELRRSGGTVAADNIFFDFGSDELRPDSYWELDRLAEILQSLPQQRIEVAGHTDIIGGIAANKTLSQRRAESVVNYLVSKGCASRNLSSRGYGANVPVANNESDDGRARNRRVELRFVK
jgi:WD40 repeat protein/outer membrane protein OmpA-like peptidoglycan-associated protein